MFETVVENDMLILEGSKETSDCNWTRTQNHLVCKRTLNHLAKLQILRLATIECGFTLKWVRDMTRTYSPRKYFLINKREGFALLTPINESSTIFSYFQDVDFNCNRIQVTGLISRFQEKSPRTLSLTLTLN